MIGDDDIDANADDDEDWMMMKLMLGDGDIDDDNGDDIYAKADDYDFDQFFSLFAVYHQLIQIDINNLKISRTIPHHPHIIIHPPAASLMFLNSSSPSRNSLTYFHSIILVSKNLFTHLLVLAKRRLGSYMCLSG